MATATAATEIEARSHVRPPYCDHLDKRALAKIRYFQLFFVVLYRKRGPN